jgi:transcriptional regulator with XRE-family HTH domain
MMTRIREVRRAKRLSLQQVAERCHPPTTPQTIGRLETGTRTVSLDWLNRIAQAMDVASEDLVHTPHRSAMPVVAVLEHTGVHAPRHDATAVEPRPGAEMVAIKVASSIGDYRSGDEVWCARLEPAGYADALNRDVLLPRPGGRFLFGRLIGREGSRLHLLSLTSGNRQMVIEDPPWAAVARTLIRTL